MDLGGNELALICCRLCSFLQYHPHLHPHLDKVADFLSVTKSKFFLVRASIKYKMDLSILTRASVDLKENYAIMWVKSIVQQ